MVSIAESWPGPCLLAPCLPRPARIHTGAQPHPAPPRAGGPSPCRRLSPPARHRRPAECPPAPAASRPRPPSCPGWPPARCPSQHAPGLTAAPPAPPPAAPAGGTRCRAHGAVQAARWRVGGQPRRLGKRPAGSHRGAKGARDAQQTLGMPTLAILKSESGTGGRAGGRRRCRLAPHAPSPAGHPLPAPSLRRWPPWGSCRPTPRAPGSAPSAPASRGRGWRPPCQSAQTRVGGRKGGGAGLLLPARCGRSATRPASKARPGSGLKPQLLAERLAPSLRT